MATTKNKILRTESAIKALPLETTEDPPIPEGKSRIYRFVAGNPIGLALRVYGNGRKSFMYCYTSDELDAREVRVEKRLAIGVEWTPGGGCLAYAEEKLKKKLKELGEKPMESRAKKIEGLRKAKQESAKEITVGKLIDRYIHEHAKPNKRSWKEDESRLNALVRPIWGTRKAKHITRADVAALVTPIAVGDEDVDLAPRKALANHLLAVVRKMGSTPKSRTVVKGWKTSNPLWRSFAAFLGCGAARCIRTHPLLPHRVSDMSCGKSVRA